MKILVRERTKIETASIRQDIGTIDEYGSFNLKKKISYKYCNNFNNCFFFFLVYCT